jgi:CRP-like cAMP-binding protein
LAESLLFLLNTYGLEDDGRTIRVYLSRDDLASLSNMTASNAIRTLTQFSEESIIETEGRRLKILNRQKLEHISEIG